MVISFRLHDHEADALDAILARHGIALTLPDLARDATLRIITTGDVPPPVRRERPPRRNSVRRSSSST